MVLFSIKEKNKLNTQLYPTVPTLMGYVNSYYQGQIYVYDVNSGMKLWSLNRTDEFASAGSLTLMLGNILIMTSSGKDNVTTYTIPSEWYNKYNIVNIYCPLIRDYSNGIGNFTEHGFTRSGKNITLVNHPTGYARAVIAYGTPK